jgi:hypothetical protein
MSDLALGTWHPPPRYDDPADGFFLLDIADQTREAVRTRDAFIARFKGDPNAPAPVWTVKLDGKPLPRRVASEAWRRARWDRSGESYAGVWVTP